MARPQSTDHHLQRDAILEFAAARFAADGFAASTMLSIATDCGTSKARLYHYYGSKNALLFDLLDRYTLRLLELVDAALPTVGLRGESQPAALHGLIRAFLREYETSATKHVALLHGTQHLAPVEREVIVGRQRAIVAAFGRMLVLAYPARVNASNQTPLTMMLMGMMNWTFTWLKPGGAMSYADFADEVVRTLEFGFQLR